MKGIFKLLTVAPIFLMTACNGEATDSTPADTGRDLSKCSLSFRVVTANGGLSINDLARPEHIAAVERMEPNFPGDHPWFVTFTDIGAKRMFSHTSSNPEGDIAMLCDGLEIFRARTLKPFGKHSIVQAGSGAP
ncbi:hypothetical protein [Lysobacter cavernae]|uniref:hypothetical protein n=1 Tax=Lysobacter cavernae TaxID=1685901 RepID=UPI0036DD8F2F